MVFGVDRRPEFALPHASQAGIELQGYCRKKQMKYVLSQVSQVIWQYVSVFTVANEFYVNTIFRKQGCCGGSAEALLS